MKRIAITGGIACGKSLVGKILMDRGVPVCDTDDLAHDVMRPGQQVYASVVAAFGPGILNAAGDIDRAKLGRTVFADSAKLQRLNGLVHPAVNQAWRQWLQARPADTRMAGVIIPLLFEVGAMSGWDAVICVTSSHALQLARLQERGLNAAEATARIAAQWPLAVKMERADFVIANYGAMTLVEEQTYLVIKSMLGE